MLRSSMRLSVRNGSPPPSSFSRCWRISFSKFVFSSFARNSIEKLSGKKARNKRKARKFAHTHTLTYTLICGEGVNMWWNELKRNRQREMLWTSSWCVSWHHSKLSIPCVPSQSMGWTFFSLPLSLSRVCTFNFKPISDHLPIYTRLLPHFNRNRDSQIVQTFYSECTDANFYGANLISFSSSSYWSDHANSAVAFFSYRFSMLSLLFLLLPILLLSVCFHFNALKMMVCVFYWRMTTYKHTSAHTHRQRNKILYMQWTRLIHLYA